MCLPWILSFSGDKNSIFNGENVLLGISIVEVVSVLQQI